MSFDPVPWFTGGGAQHSPEVARLLAYAATNGAEGVVSPGDLKVVPLDIPGSSVRVLSGAFLALNKAAGGSQQTYVDRNPTEDTVAISATGSGGGRSDLIVARVEDPFMPGEPWADPADVTVGPYVFSRVVPNVPSSAIVNNASATAYLATLGYSAIPLAAVTLPVSTATITAGMIKDLREVANPRRKRAVRVYTPTALEEPFPGGAGETTWPFLGVPVACPEWATRVKIKVDLGQILYQRGSFTGHARAKYGPDVATEYSGIHFVDGGYEVRNGVVIAGDLAIPASYRGTTQSVTVHTVINPGSVGWPQSDIWTTVTVDLEFEEVAE